MGEPETPGLNGLGAVGVVAIGRNEGDRLRRCLDALPHGLRRAVYVDSASSDGSVDEARRRGVEVVELDMTIPFTAARARNAGLRRLRELCPDLRFVQLLDGDCVLDPGFIPAALSTMGVLPRAALVCGRRREIAPEASVYNLLADMEWDGAPGEVASCGGDVLARMEALAEVGGYDDRIIAGEEPEMCARLRARGWTIQRIAQEMTRHDAAMTRFAQWWNRSVRSGYGFTQVSGIRAGVFDQEMRSAAAWGLLLPAVALLGAALAGGLGLLLLLAYPAQTLRVALRRLATGQRPSHAALYAFSCVLGKLPQGLGVAQCWWNRYRGRERGLIEYK